MVTFGEAISLGFRNTFNYTGVSTRAEYWWFVLFGFIASFVGQIAAAVVPPFAIVLLVFFLAMGLANLSLTVRRLRDAGAWLGWFFLMILGVVVMVVGVFQVAMDGGMSGLESMALEMEGKMAMDAMGEPSGTGAIMMTIGMLMYLISGLVCFVYTLIPSR